MTHYLTTSQQNLDNINYRINKNESNNTWITIKSIKHKVYRKQDNKSIIYFYKNDDIVYLVPKEFWAINEY